MVMAPEDERGGGKHKAMLLLFSLRRWPYLETNIVEGSRRLLVHHPSGSGWPASLTEGDGRNEAHC
jgi:hypothetical protein